MLLDYYLIFVIDREIRAVFIAAEGEAFKLVHIEIRLTGIVAVFLIINVIEAIFAIFSVCRKSSPAHKKYSHSVGAAMS